MPAKIPLQDIQGLDPISWFPLAIGWWLLFAVILTLLLITILSYFWQKRKKSKWEFRLLKKLELIENTLSQSEAQIAAREVEELMRRLAIHRYSRKECANLHGDAWLEWLTEKDMAKVNWLQFSNILIDAPFQPPGAALNLETLKKTIKAAKGWVK
jgi:hypothetical protein